MGSLFQGNYQISSWASWALRSVTPFRQAGPILVAGGQTQCHSNLPAVSAVWHIFGFESAGLMFNLFSVKIGRYQANPDRVRTSAWLCEYFKAPPLTLTILIATFPLLQNGTTFGWGVSLDWVGGVYRQGHRISYTSLQTSMVSFSLSICSSICFSIVGGTGGRGNLKPSKWHPSFWEP